MASFLVFLLCLLYSAMLKWIMFLWYLLVFFYFDPPINKPNILHCTKWLVKISNHRIYHHYIGHNLRIKLYRSIAFIPSYPVAIGTLHCIYSYPLSTRSSKVMIVYLRCLSNTRIWIPEKTFKYSRIPESFNTKCVLKSRFYLTEPLVAISLVPKIAIQ